MNRILEIEIAWEEGNYSCGYAEETLGMVICTDKNLEKLNEKFRETLKLHIDGMIEDGDSVPEWCREGYDINFTISTPTLNKG